jgi:vacuolar-type H+-ATPase subunit F/Vma7
VIAEHTKIFPTILEIPNKDNPYDPVKDTIVIRAAGILWGQDTGAERLAEM